MYEIGAKTFLKENLCALQVFMCALISRLCVRTHEHRLQGIIIYCRPSYRRFFSYYGVTRSWKCPPSQPLPSSMIILVFYSVVEWRRKGSQYGLRCALELFMWKVLFCTSVHWFSTLDRCLQMPLFAVSSRLALMMQRFSVIYIGKESHSTCSLEYWICSSHSRSVTAVTIDRF